MLSEPVRLRLLALAAEEELAIGELADLLGESQPNVSRHLAPLRQVGLVLGAARGHSRARAPRRGGGGRPGRGGRARERPRPLRGRREPRADGRGRARARSVARAFFARARRRRRSPEALDETVALRRRAVAPAPCPGAGGRRGHRRRRAARRARALVRACRGDRSLGRAARWARRACHAPRLPQRGAPRRARRARAPRSTSARGPTSCSRRGCFITRRARWTSCGSSTLLAKPASELAPGGAVRDRRLRAARRRVDARRGRSVARLRGGGAEALRPEAGLEDAEVIQDPGRVVRQGEGRAPALAGDGFT